MKHDKYKVQVVDCIHWRLYKNIKLIYNKPYKHRKCTLYTSHSRNCKELIAGPSETSFCTDQNKYRSPMPCSDGMGRQFHPVILRCHHPHLRLSNPQSGVSQMLIRRSRRQRSLLHTVSSKDPLLAEKEADKAQTNKLHQGFKTLNKKA